MEKYHGFDKQFYQYLFAYIVKEGGLRLQVVAADLVKQLQQKFDAKHNLNLYRKQYGNIYEALKTIKDPFFILDSMVIKMKKPNEVGDLYKKGCINKALYNAYEVKLKQNLVKQIQILKINHENKCKKCNDNYNINVNKNGSCDKGGQHDPMY